MKSKNKLLLIVLCPMFLWVGWNHILGRAALCSETWKFASHEDLIYFALGYANHDLEKDFDGQSLKNYQENHKDCCSVSFGEKSFFSLLLGDDFYEVKLVYKRKAEAVLNEGYDYYVKYVEVNSCGKRGDIFGEAIKLNEK